MDRSFNEDWLRPSYSEVTKMKTLSVLVCLISFLITFEAIAVKKGACPQQIQINELKTIELGTTKEINS